ncbi:C3 and PZP-like alpha-2-macroglobulin domain-containing protein 8 [Tribolium madens]|uniref:C3 and PZP-like alpha-2-macroglobulin domain-containing protein 8 n=1 Tax=Tribolium madens TaxID=41895 RepID=UPI001CF72AB0|nr:C3 and PZP-like alpha-2-macroglobulin domain-containing protein 8 [Tribolium madens]
MEFPAVLLTLLLSKAVISLGEDCTTGFSVVAPELAVPGKTTAVLVTLHGPTSLRPLNVTLRLLPDAQKGTTQQLVETTQEIRGHGILPLEVPLEASGSYVLQTLVNCTGNDRCELQSSSQMRLVGPVRDVIIRPAKHAYRPGETVSFWVLALDHDLQIALGAIGSVSIKDPAGTKVALWDQVALDEGVKAFTLPLSEYVNSGRWLLHVEVESAEFSAPIEIAPGAGNGLPDVAAAEEHYVELRFGREMRRSYKPGLPFAGKVEAMSTEKSVRVRVKVYDNTTSIYSQDIEISNGEGTFVVPAILADSNIIALQAELVSVDSKEIESHYVLAREPIHKWNSSSDCYLLIEGVEHTLQPEEEAHVAILSTCPCERDLHYVITTDGRVTDWAQRRYEDPVPPATSASAGAVCRLNFSFTVRSVMAPVSQLLVYYVTPQGEPVSDVISFDVKLLHRQVYVNLEEREYWLPGQSLDVEVVAERSSLVCLLGGRSGGNGDVKFDPRISEEREPATVAGEIDFLEAGVSFFQRQCVKRGNSGISAVSYRQRGSGAGPSNRRRPPESLVGGAPFDQLWLWKCFNYSSEIASTGLTISAPQEAGKWSLWALTVSSNGLRFSSSVNVQVFRPLQAEFHLPPSLRVRETLEVDIKIGNNINSCMDVTALLALSEGAQFLSNGLLYVTERLRLGPHGATSLVVKLLVTTPGVKNMTVEVNGYTSPSCEGSEKPGNTSLAGAVFRSATINVYPEGIVRTDTESAYFCANENLVISTADKYKYEWVAAPRNHEGIVLELKAVVSKRIGPIHIALAESRSPSDKMYRLTIGDVNNMITWIGRGKHGYGVQLTRVETPGILSEDEWSTFWITWEKNTIAFGNGSIPHNNTLLKWRMDKKIKIQQVGFASSWGSSAEFRIWNFNEEAGFSQVLHLDTPKSVVPGSEWGKLLVTGGLALPAINKKIEGGGLSGALAALTPLLTLQHLGKKANKTERLQALQSLPGDIQDILSYRKVDNSFSEHQMLGSHTATVSILEALTKVQSYLNIDPDLIQAIKRWVQLRQEDDGRFSPLPADVKFPSSKQTDFMRKNLSSEIALLEHVIEITADTVITLYEIEIENDADSETLQKAKIFLENSLPKLETPETIAVVALALVLVRSATASWAIEKLRNVSTTEDGEFGWPHLVPRRDAADWLYESESEKTLKEPLATTLDEYKASLHALSTFCIIGDLKFAESVARYLFYRSHMLDKHPELLYQAVKTFTQYDLLAKDRHRALTVSLATSGMELTDTLELKPDKPPQSLHLPSLPTKVFVYATGAGCATIQGKVSYSTYSVQRTTPLLELWSGVVQEILPDRSSVEEIEGKLPMLKLKTCFRWKGKTPSGILRLEISLFSGFELATTPPQLLNPPEDMSEMQHNFHDNKLWFIFANISTLCPVCVQYMARSAFVISSLRPAYAKVYPAGRQDLAAETFFHTKIGSNLLKSITEDDLITWFGKNRTDISEPYFQFPQSCIREVSTTASTTTISTTTDNLPVPSPKLEVLSVATYTINVDNQSISNINDTRKLIESTSLPYSTSTEIPESSTLGVTENMIEENAIPHHDEEKILKKKSRSITVMDRNLKTTTVPNQVVTESITTFSTPSEVTTKLTEKELVVDKNVSPPKHINTIIQNSPIKYIEKDGKHSEESLATFAPEIKNDQYVLLDKEELWGMLKEVVDDQLKKKTNSKIVDGEKLRSQGFT